MGVRGPAPKRDAERRRQNKPDQPTDAVSMPGAVRAPGPEKDWCPIAKAWYQSLKTSGQGKFYEPSDWATAKYAAELMSRLLDQGARPSAQMVASLNSLLSSLLVTEGDRRRVRMEIDRLPEQGNAEVTAMDAYRRARES